STVEGLAFAPDGKVWVEGDNRIVEVGEPGKEKLKVTAPERPVLFDVAPGSGAARVLVGAARTRHRVIFRSRSAPRDVDLSAFDQSFAADLSADGRKVLFTEYGGGALYGVYLRPTDGSGAVRLGEGAACGLSADGKYALAMLLSTPPALTLVPL